MITYLYGAFDCMFLSCHVRVSSPVAVTSTSDITDFEIYVVFLFACFFLSGSSFTDMKTHGTAGEGKGRDHLYSSQPVLPVHWHLDIYLQLCMWGGSPVFLIASLVTTRLLLDDIYHFLELPIDWLIEDWTRFCYNNFDMGNRWIWTHIDYHHGITSEPTNEVG